MTPSPIIGNGFIILPFSLFIVVALFAGAWLLTRRTAIGLFVESVGINFRSSLYAGINEKRIKLFAYVVLRLLRRESRG